MSDSDNIFYEPEDYDYRRIGVYGGVEPESIIQESRSSATDKAIEDALFGNLKDDDIDDNSFVNVVQYETRPRLTIKDILEETNKIFDSAVKKPDVRAIILGKINEGQIFNATKWLIANFNAPYADVPNLDPEDEPYDADDITDTIFKDPQVSDALVNGIKTKISGDYDMPAAVVAYLYLAIIGPIDSPNTRDDVSDSVSYNINILNDSFKVLDESVPVSKNVYGSPLKIANETDTSALEEPLSDAEVVQAAVIASPTNDDNIVLTETKTETKPEPEKESKLKARDRVYDLTVKAIRSLGIPVDEIQYALDNKNSDKEGPYAKLKARLRDELKKELRDIIEKNKGVEYEYKSIDDNIMFGKTGKTESAINKTLNSQIDGILLEKGTPIPGIAEKLINMPRDAKPVGRPPVKPAPTPTPTKSKNKSKSTVVTQPIKKLDMSKFSEMADILNSRFGQKVEEAKKKNAETVNELTKDKQDAKSLVGIMFANKKPIEEVSSDLAKSIKIPPPPPLNLGEIIQATTVVNNKAKKIKNTAGYSQTPRDSIVTTLTVIKLLQPIIKDDDVRIRLGAAEALLMSKAYDSSTINAIDSYLKSAINNKLEALKAFDTDYSQAEGDLLDSMLNVLDNKSNPDNPSKLFKYATYVKRSNNKLPMQSKRSSTLKTDYLKSIDEGVKQLNIKRKKPTKSSVKEPTKKQPAKPRQPRKPSKKVIKTTLQKQQERIKRIKSARDKLKLFNALDSHIPQVQQAQQAQAQQAPQPDA